VYGKKDKSSLISRGTYRAKLNALTQKYLVFWDVEHKRGWLVNGPSALLHLLRSSLELNKSDDLASIFLFEPNKFEDAKAPYTISASMEVLLNTTNLDMELFLEEERDETGANIYFRV
jgi:hypothetical protein